MSLIWKLQVENAFLKQKQSLYLDSITYSMVKYYERYIEQAYYAWIHPNFQKYYEINNPDYQLITITFDPSLFGEYNDPESEKQYILHELMKCIDKGYFNSFVGCFEYQENGTIHAHLAAHLAINWREIYKYLKSRFTANPKNIYAINFGEHKLTPRWLCYLNKCNYPPEKQSQHIFTFGWQHSLDDENWFLNKSNKECSVATASILGKDETMNTVDPTKVGSCVSVAPKIPGAVRTFNKIQNEAAKKAQIQDYEKQIEFYQNEIKILKKNIF